MSLSSLPTLSVSAVLHGALIVGGILFAGSGRTAPDRTVRLEFRASAAESEADLEHEEIVIQEPSEPLPVPDPLPELVPYEEAPPDEDLPDLEPLLEPTEAPPPPARPFALDLVGRRTKPPSPPVLRTAPAQPVVVRRSPPAEPPRPAAASQSALRPLSMPRISAETYPPEALRRGVQGTAVVEITVDASGRVVDVKLHASSGSPLLDADALVRAREFRFAPIPSPRRTRVPIHYRIT